MSPERSFQMSSPETGMKRKPEAERKAENSQEALRIPEKKDRKQTAHSPGLWMSPETVVSLEALEKAVVSQEALRIPEMSLEARTRAEMSPETVASREMLRIPETERNRETQHQTRLRSRGRIRIPDRCSRQNRQIRMSRRKNRRVRALLKRTL